MLLRPVVVHFAVVTLLLPVAAVCAILDRVDAIRASTTSPTNKVTS